MTRTATIHPIDAALALLLWAAEGVCWLINEALGHHSPAAAPAPVLALPAAAEHPALPAAVLPAVVLPTETAPEATPEPVSRAFARHRWAEATTAELTQLHRQAEDWTLTDRQVANRIAKRERLAAQDAAALDWIAAGSPEPIVYAAKPADVRKVARELDRHDWACAFLAWYAKQPAAKRPVRKARRARTRKVAA